MRPPRSLVDIFDDCVSRLAAGQSLEACLALYPDHASRLRPLLENVETLSALRVPQAELVEDQALVWSRIMGALPQTVPQRRGGYRGLLLAAVLLALLLSLIGATWFVLTRPDLPREDQQMIIPPSETALPVLPTVSATPSSMPTLTASPSATHTPTPATTPSRTPTPTITSAATTAACDGPATLQGAIGIVNALYPSTAVTSAAQKTLPSGAAVWLITTSQQVRITIDAACGLVLSVEQVNGGGVGSGRGGDSAGHNANTSGANNNASSSDGGTNDNANSNDDSSRSGRGASGSDDNDDDNGDD